ncbi:unnamed protein product [Brugia timori]|uniref:Uncharacterized protein n=1 Tax=Brugia timori TaxID=42155 RepID=A0A0R3Q7A2_9BILA|nr:unnamed protein product [Brugia timori]
MKNAIKTDLQQLRMLLEDHIDHLNNIYFTLFLNGFSAIQFPDGQTVNLAEFQGTKLKLIPRTNILSADVLSSTTTTDEDLFTSPPYNNNGSFTDISNIKTFTEGMETKQNMDVSLNDNGQSSRNFLISKENDDIEGYLQWMNGQTTICQSYHTMLETEVATKKYFERKCYDLFIIMI